MYVACVVLVSFCGLTCTMSFFVLLFSRIHMRAEVFTYLDVKQRVAVLNTRAEVVRELFEMLRDELKHQQANKLEIIVIWLIVADGICTTC